MMGRNMRRLLTIGHDAAAFTALTAVFATLISEETLPVQAGFASYWLVVALGLFAGTFASLVWAAPLPFSRTDMLIETPVIRLTGQAMTASAIWVAGVFVIKLSSPVTPIIVAALFPAAALWFILTREAVRALRQRHAFRTTMPATGGGPTGAHVLVCGTADAVAATLGFLSMSGMARSFVPAGVLLTEPAGRVSVNGVPVLGTIDALGQTIARLETECTHTAAILMAAPAGALTADAEHSLALIGQRKGIPVVDVMDGWNEAVWTRLPFQETTERSIREAYPDLVPPGSYLTVRRGVDLVIAAAGLILVSPIMLALFAVIRASLGGPALFRQKRVGRYLQPFTLYKFRTMHIAVDDSGDLLPSEQRASVIGMVIRRLHLDELPQLWNVLIGDLSLIGPRPLVEHDIADLPDHGWLRSLVPPGMTGWAQVNGGQRVMPEDKFLLDVQYIKRLSPWLDLKVMILTFVKVVAGDQLRPEAARQAFHDIKDVVAAALPDIDLTALDPDARSAVIDAYWQPDPLTKQRKPGAAVAAAE